MDRNLHSPLVSIALPIFNAEKTLAQAIRSICSQTFADWELIALDDGSTDGSVSIVANFGDPRIKLFSDGRNLGIAARLNQAIDLSKGRYFARMDADDISFPQRIELQIEFITAHRDIDLLATGAIIFTGNADPLGVFPTAPTHESICRRPWRGFYFPHPTWLGRTEWFQRHRYRPSMNNAEDQDLLLRTYRYSRFACLSQILLGYREEPRTLKKMIKARYAFFKAVFSDSLTHLNISIIFLSAFLQLFKTFGDACRIYGGINFLRNPLLPTTPLQLQQLQDLYQRLNNNTC